MSVYALPPSFDWNAGVAASALSRVSQRHSQVKLMCYFVPLLATYQPESTTLATRHRYLLQPCSIRCSVAIFRPVSAESVFGDDDELPVLRHRVVLQLAESCPRLELRFSLCNHDGQVARLE